MPDASRLKQRIDDLQHRLERGFDDCPKCAALASEVTKLEKKLTEAKKAGEFYEKRCDQLDARVRAMQQHYAKRGFP